MSIKIRVSNILVYIIYILAAALAFTCLYIFVHLSNATQMVSGDNKIAGLKNEFNLIKYFFVIAPVIVCTMLVLMICHLNKLSRRIKKEESEKCERLVDSYRQNIEKLSKSINDLTNMYNSALEYDMQKTEFFSNISHELKTPLSIILGAVQLLDQNKTHLPAERRKTAKHISIIKHNSYRLLRLINNFLDLTKIDAGYAKINMTNCNIVYLIEEITQSVAPFAEQKKLTLEFDTEIEEIHTAVDVDKIERIILNLLSNAIKFTGANGKITVRVWEEDGKVAISVKDTGTGIPKGMVDSIFERFRQVNSTLTREYEGSGIGLSIVKSFVELHGGNIEVKSEEGRGTEFILRLPIRVHTETCSQASPSVKRDQSKIIEAINVELSDIYTIDL